MRYWQELQLWLFVTLPAWIEAHPVMFMVVFWPAITAVVNFIFRKRTKEELDAMNPRAAYLLRFIRSSGLDATWALGHLWKVLRPGKAMPTTSPKE